MKFIFVIAFISIFLYFNLFSQDNVGIGTTNPDPTAILELSATDKGLLIPRLTTAQRNAITTPAIGLIIYNTTDERFQYYTGITNGWLSLVTTSSLPLSNGKVYVGNGSGLAEEQTLSGDASISNTGVLTIGNDKITTAKILDANVTNAKIADDAITNTKVSSTAEIEVSKLANSVTDLQIIRTNGTAVEWWTPNFLSSSTSAGGDLTGNYPNPTIADNAVDGSKIQLSGNAIGDIMYYDGTDWVRLAPGNSGYMLQTNGAGNAPSWAASSANSLNSGEIFVGNGSNVAQGRIMGGDATIDNTGVITIGNDKITTAKILNSNVTNAKLATGIDATKLADGSVTNAEFQYLGGVTSDIQTQLNAKITKTLPTGYIIVGNASGEAEGVNPSGNISVTETGGLNIKAGQIQNSQLATNIQINVNYLAEGPATGDLLRTEGGDVVWWTPDFLGNGSTAGGDLAGTYPNPTVDGLQGRAVHNAAPVDGQVLTWNNAQSRWEAQTPSASSGWALSGNSLTGTEIFGSTNAQPVPFFTNNTERMRIWDDGQIGINRSTTFDDSIKVWLSGDMLIDGDLIVTGTIDPIALQLIPQNTTPNSLLNKEGFMYYDNTTNTVKITNGTSWSELGSNLTNGLDLKNSDNLAKELKFYEPSTSGTNYTAFKAQAQAGDVTYTLPAADGTNGQVLKTNGSGGLSWESPSTPRMSVTTISSATTLTANHELVLCSGSDFTITLPSAVGITGKVYTIKAIITGDNTYTIQAQSGQQIDNTTSKNIRSSANAGIIQGYQIVSNGSNWHIISKVIN